MPSRWTGLPGRGQEQEREFGKIREGAHPGHEQGRTSFSSGYTDHLIGAGKSRGLEPRTDDMSDFVLDYDQSQTRQNIPRTTTGTTGGTMERPMVPGSPGTYTPGTPGYDIPALQTWEAPKQADMPQYEGYRHDHQEYTAPDQVRDQRTEAQMRDMVGRQAAMRYDPQIQAIQREHPRMQRQAQEAMGAQGLAGSGLAMREAAIPLAQQTQQQLGDVRAERGHFEQTGFDEMQERERTRTDRLMQEHFNRFLQEQQLGMTREDMDFSQWLGTQDLHRGLAGDDYSRFMDQQKFGLQHAQAQAASRGTQGRVTGGAPPRPATDSEMLQEMKTAAELDYYLRNPQMRYQPDTGGEPTGQIYQDWLRYAPTTGEYGAQMPFSEFERLHGKRYEDEELRGSY